MTDHEAPASAARRGRPAAWRQIALGLAILFCGVVMGSAGTMLATRRVLSRGMPPADKAARGLTQRMDAQLNLSPKQKHQVAEIVSRHLKALRATRKEQFRLMHDEVAAVLTPEQAAAWRRGFERFQRSGPDHPRDHRPPRKTDHSGGAAAPGGSRPGEASLR